MEEEAKHILAKLFKIQQKLKCKKGQYNSFGKYKFRSCEDILESVKPLLNENKCVITLSDELVVLGDNAGIHYTEKFYDKDLGDENERNVVVNCQRFYIRAMAVITDIETGEQIYNTAYAREEEFKKGMDGSQITGTASSYARKYALSGLLAIDDTKDADTDEYANQTKKTATKTTTTKADKYKIQKGQIDILNKFYVGENMDKLLKANNLTKLEDMSMTKASEIIKKLQDISKENDK